MGCVFAILSGERAPSLAFSQDLVASVEAGTAAQWKVKIQAPAERLLLQQWEVIMSGKLRYRLLRDRALRWQWEVEIRAPAGAGTAAASEKRMWLLRKRILLQHLKRECGFCGSGYCCSI